MNRQLLNAKKKAFQNKLKEKNQRNRESIPNMDDSSMDEVPMQYNQQYNQQQFNQQPQYNQQQFNPQPQYNQQQYNNLNTQGYGNMMSSPGYMPPNYNQQLTKQHMHPQQMQQQISYNGMHNNLSPNQLNRGNNNANIRQYSNNSEVTFEEKSVEITDFGTGGKTINTPPKNISKNALCLALASGKNKYGDANKFKIIQKDSLNVVYKTMAVSTVMFTFADDIFMKVARAVTNEKCNQSVFNYPVSPSRKVFSVKRVEDLIEAYNKQILNYKQLILNSIGKTVTESSSRVYNAPKEVIDDTLRFAARGVHFMNIVFKKAMVMLHQLINDAGNRVYPSIEHHLYEGDYTDIFAFQVLRYLFKADKAKNIEIKGTRDVTTSLVNENPSKVLPKTRTYGREAASSGEYYGNFAKHPDQHYSENDSELSSFDGTTDFQDNQSKHFHIQVASNHSRAKDNKPSFGDLDMEEILEVFLKPSRGTKILLATEPNFFLYNLNYAVSKGLSILINTGIIPDKMITNLKLVSLYSGAIYKINSNKKGLSIIPDRSLGSHASMKQVEWSQFSLFVDIIPLIHQNEQIKKTLYDFREKHQTLFFDAEKYKFSEEEQLTGVYRNCKSILKSAFQNEVFDEYSQQLVNIMELSCRTPQLFCKAKDKNALYYYNAIIKYVNYNSGSDVLTGKELNGLMNVPKKPDYVYGQFGLSNDIDITYYKEKSNYTDRTLIFTADQYEIAAANDLAQFPRMQIPLLYRRDSKTRTRKYDPQKIELDESSDTLEEHVFNIGDKNDPFTGRKVTTDYDELSQEINGIYNAGYNNMTSYLISPAFNPLIEYYRDNPFDLDYNEQLEGLNRTTSSRIQTLNDLLFGTKEEKREFTTYTPEDWAVMLIRYFIGDGRFLSSDDKNPKVSVLKDYCSSMRNDSGFKSFLRKQKSSDVRDKNKALGLFVHYIIEKLTTKMMEKFDEEVLEESEETKNPKENQQKSTEENNNNKKK